MTNKKLGLIDKYKVERHDGKPVDYGIFLEFKDPIAREGIKKWANEMRKNGYNACATDVWNKIYEYEGIGR